MSIQDKAKIGNKGEILPKKVLRETSGFKPGDEVIIEASPGQMSIRKIHTVDELLKMPRIGHGTAEELEKEINEESEKYLEKMDV